MPAPDWYHPIDYTDVTALRRVTLQARAVFLEMFGAELGSKTGLVEVRPKLIAAESDGVLTLADVDAALKNLSSNGAIVWSEAERMAYHAGHLLRHGATNPKHAAGWKSQLLAMPACSARDAAVSELGRIPYRKPIDSLSVGYRLGNQQEQEQEQEQNRNTTPAPAAPAPTGLLVDVPVEKVKRKPKDVDIRDIPPTLEATVQLLIAEGCPNMDSDRIARGCHGYWESQGWCRGKNPIKSWAGTVRTWLANQCERDRDLATAVRTSRMPEWQRQGYETEQAYADHQAVVAERRAVRLEEEKRQRKVTADFGVGLKRKQEADDEEAEYRTNNPLPVWAFPTKPPEDDEVLT